MTSGESTQQDMEHFARWLDLFQGTGPEGLDFMAPAAAALAATEAARDAAMTEHLDVEPSGFTALLDALARPQPS